MARVSLAMLPDTLPCSPHQPECTSYKAPLHHLISSHKFSVCGRCNLAVPSFTEQKKGTNINFFRGCLRDIP
eukprot:5831994-Amphidinium_carterae.1